VLAAHAPLPWYTCARMDARTELFAFDPPDLSSGEVAAILAEHWGIVAPNRPLRGERSHNSAVVVDGVERYVLHVVSASERPEVVELQTSALQHIEQVAPTVATPRVVPTREGSAMAAIERAGTTHLTRLLTFLPGVAFDPGLHLPDAAYRAIGGMLGAVAAALDGLAHPAAEHFMPWDIANGLIVDRDLRREVHDRDVVDFVAGLDDRLVAIAETMRTLPRMLIHNDGHAGNLMRSDARSMTVSGLIDFGDVVTTVVAADVAIAAESFATDHPDPGRVLAELAAGFHAHVPLSDAEIDALPELVLARAALGVLLAEHQVRHAPHLAAEEEPLMRDRMVRTARWAELDPARLADAVHRRLT
jgi:Ser/Thr protein kinase RdoA (MazF antagonist)